MSELETTKPLDELATLKERADKMGITYSPNIGIEKLKEKINAALGTDTSEERVDDKEEAKLRLKQNYLDFFKETWECEEMANLLINHFNYD